MKEINATTTYDPACSDMQEVEYTMPQSKRDITKCLMIALDNLAEAQAEIDVLRKHQDRLRKWVADGQADIDELVDKLEHSCEYMDVDKVKALIAKHRGEVI